MAFLNDSDFNVGYLSGVLYFEPAMVRAWIRAEGQAVANPTNPLNIRSAAYGALGQTGEGFAFYPDTETGLRAVLRLLEGNAPLFGYDAVLAQRGSRDAYAQARAVELSSWAAGNYGADETTLGLISRQLPEVNPPVLPADRTPSTCDLVVGVQLYDLNGAPKVKVSLAQNAYSPFASGDFRGVVVVTGGQSQVLLAKTVDLRNIVAVTKPFEDKIAAGRVAAQATVTALG